MLLVLTLTCSSFMIYRGRDGIVWKICVLFYALRLFHALWILNIVVFICLHLCWFTFTVAQHISVDITKSLHRPLQDQAPHIINKFMVRARIKVICFMMVGQSIFADQCQPLEANKFEIVNNIACHIWSHTKETCSH